MNCFTSQLGTNDKTNMNLSSFIESPLIKAVCINALSYKVDKLPVHDDNK